MKEYLKYSQKSTPLTLPIFALPICIPLCIFLQVLIYTPYTLFPCILLRILSLYVYFFMCTLFHIYSWMYILSPLCGQNSSIYAFFCIYSSHLYSPCMNTSLYLLLFVFTFLCVFSLCGFFSVYTFYNVYPSSLTFTLFYVYFFLCILFSLYIFFCI